MISILPQRRSIRGTPWALKTNYMLIFITFYPQDQFIALWIWVLLDRACQDLNLCLSGNHLG